MHTKKDPEMKQKRLLGSTSAVCTHQDLAAVAEPAAAVLSGQDEGEGLAVNGNLKQVIISKN